MDGICSAVAGVMYAVLGVPGSVIWAGGTFIVALIPVFGTFMRPPVVRAPHTSSSPMVTANATGPRIKPAGPKN